MWVREEQMKISTKTRYGTRAMAELAYNYGDAPLCAKEIAKRQRISLKYLEQLIATLRASGLIKSTRGAHGGYSLAKPPDEINLREIFQVLEGSVAPVDCVDDPESCPRNRECVTRDVWLQMRDAMAKVLDSTTLQDLVERKQEKGAALAAMYYI
jgi:Rrf2 family protein